MGGRAAHLAEPPRAGGSGERNANARDRPVNGGVAKGEDPTIRADQPVTGVAEFTETDRSHSLATSRLNSPVSEYDATPLPLMSF